MQVLYRPFPPLKMSQEHLYKSTFFLGHRVGIWSSALTLRLLITVKANKYPWMAYVYNREIGISCGGTLIASKYVVSAAHCVYRDDMLTELSPADMIVV